MAQVGETRLLAQWCWEGLTQRTVKGIQPSGLFRQGYEWGQRCQGSWPKALAARGAGIGG